MNTIVDNAIIKAYFCALLMEKDNYFKNAELSTEQNYNIIDLILFRGKYSKTSNF
jgi:hypothetical protein